MSTRMARLLLTAPVSALAACGLSEPEAESLVGCLPGYADVAASAPALLADAQVRDAAVLVRVDGQTVCRLFFGSYGPSTTVYTASAAKWLAAASLLAVVDAGALTLDTRTVQLFPAASGQAADITLAQLLSHTSGLLSFSRCMGRSDDTLQECAETILAGDLHFAPGDGFFYAGPPYTVAGAMAERAMERPWAEIFRTTIAQPLGMTRTGFGDGPNPALSEGEVQSTLDEYGRFAQMILDHGLYRGRRVLSDAAIREMRRDRTSGLPSVYSPRGELPYGLGAWLDAVDAEGTGTVLSSPGAGGFVPIVDFPRRMVFVFESFGEIDRSWPAIVALLQQVRVAVDREGLSRAAGLSVSSPPRAARAVLDGMGG